MGDELGRQPQYDVFADEYLDHAEDSFFNAYVDRPACLELLGDVRGRRVLDAACGPGIYADELTRRGATVTGFDVSPRMVGFATSRVPTARFRAHDLNDPLDWADDDSFDLVLCVLAIEYVDDRVGALRELHRVLVPDGAVVVSRLHPTADWLRHGGDYFATRVVEETWDRGWNVRFWIAPLEQTCAEVAAAGFLIERLVEPRPIPDARAHDPARFERYSGAPAFVAMRLVAR